MKLKVNCYIPECESLYVKVNNEVKKLYSFEPFVIFDLDAKKEYILEVERRPDKSNRTPINILIFIITIIIQGLYNILFINVDGNWFKNITPYGIIAKIVIHLNQDTEVNLTYMESKYISNRFKNPELTSDIGKIISINYSKNTENFKNQYFNYTKRILSILSVGLVLFTFLLIVAIKNDILFGAIFVALIIVGLISVSVVNLKIQYKKLKGILDNCLS